MAWIVAATAVTAAFGLLLPWAESGSRSRSSIELLRSAAALDLFSTVERWLLVLAWFAVVALAAAGLIAVAWHRIELGAVAFGVIGPALVIAVVVVRRSPLGVDWGAYASSGLGVVASIGSGMLLTRRSRTEGLER